MTKHLFSVGVLLATFAYSIVRYNIFGPVYQEQIPLYITNKAFSWAGLILIGASPFFRKAASRAYIGIFGGVLTAMHVLASLTVFQPKYFSKFYLSNEYLKWEIEVSMLTGTIATVIVGVLMMATFSNRPPDAANPRNPYAWFGRAALLLTCLHVLFMGFAGWLTPGKWHGGLPPITLLSFLMGLGFLMARFVTVTKRWHATPSGNGVLHKEDRFKQPL